MDSTVRRKRSPRISPEQRESLLAALAESGLSVVDFARSRGMRPETFYRWHCDANKANLRKSRVEPQRDARSMNFVEVSTNLPGSSSPHPMVVRLGRNVELEVWAVDQLDWVAHLNTKLGASQC